MKTANPEQSKRYGPRASAGRPAARAVFAALALAAALTSHAAAAAAQQPAPSPAKPNIAGEVEVKKANGEKDDNNNNRGTDAPGRKPGRVKQPKPQPAYEVNFKTDIPEAEIFLGHGGMSLQSLGKTDAEGKLTTRLVRGTHNITASRSGYQIQRQRIEVRPGTNNVNFRLALPIVEVKKEEEEKKPEEPAPVAEDAGTEQAADPLAEADAVIKRFLDARETDGVAADDWKLVRDRTGAALEKEPDNAQLKAQARAAEGQLAYLAGDYPSALVAFRQAAIAAPEYTLAHYGLGNAYLATNQPAEAFKAYGRAAALSKEMALAYRGMGDALAKQNKTKEAAQYYNRAKSFGQPLPTNTGLASARDLKKRKRWAQALKEFQQVAESEPSAEVYVDIGDCYVGLEQPLSASQAYRKAAELDPKSALAHYRYGEVMHKLREYASAMESFERALALDLEGTVINRKRAREMADQSAERIKKME
jgi:tetratricopeptide (TPR) repeat protein